MNDLLDFVLDAHGGLKRWSGVSTVTAKLAVGGPFWGTANGRVGAGLPETGRVQRAIPRHGHPAPPVDSL